MNTKENVKEYYRYCDKSYQHWGQTKKNEIYEIHYGYFDNKHKTHKEALINMNNVLAKTLNPKRGWKILDSGCGVGASSIFLAKNYPVNVVGITVSNLQIKKAKKFANIYKVKKYIKFENRNFEKTNFANKTFDGIWGLESVCYANNKKNYINEAYRILKPNGRFICADFFATKENLNPREKYAMDNWLNGWVMPNLATKDLFKKSMQKAGFKNIKIIDITSNILPSSKEIYNRGKQGYPEDIFEKRSPLQMEHVKANIFQYTTLKMNLWKYLIFYGEKK